MTLDDFLVLRRQKIEHRLLDVIEKFVDDAERVDAHAVVTGLLLDAGIVADVEADHDRLAGGCGLDVVERDVARAGGDDAQSHLLGLDLAERLHDRLKRTLGVGLDDDVEFTLPFGGHAGHERVERGGLVHRKLLLLLLLGGLLGERARALFVKHDAEFRARFGNAGKTGALDGGRGIGLLDAAAVVVDERTDLAEVLADENGVAHLERAAGDEQRRARTETLLQLRLDDVAVGAAVGVGGKLQNFGLHENILQKTVHAFTGDTRHRAADNVAAPIFRRETRFLQLLFDAVDVGRGLVALCDGDHHLHARLAGDADALLRLRHDAVVGGDDDDRDIRKLGTAGAHGAERRVAGGIEERDLLARNLHLIGADLLGDAAGFAGRDVLFADPVHERRLAVVDVTEEGDDRRSRFERLGGILRNEIVGIDRLENGLCRGLVAGVLDSDLEAVLLRDLGGDVRFDALVDGSENLQTHQIGDQTVGLDVELRREILDDDRAADGDLLRFLVDGDAATLLRNLRGDARNLLVKTLLSFAALLALARSALVIFVIDRLGRFRFRRGGNGNRNRSRRPRVLKRLESGGGKTGLRGGNGRKRLRLVAGSHADRRLRGGNFGRLLHGGRRFRGDRRWRGGERGNLRAFRSLLRDRKMAFKRVLFSCAGVFAHRCGLLGLRLTLGLNGGGIDSGERFAQTSGFGAVDGTDGARCVNSGRFSDLENVGARDACLLG